ncbi:acyltransferase family protein [Kurthia massiliensis]|uniref:acyltransferase family protein n=1 Tax=Kurthia massiliensis TaxID=1033739 RepID=UPI00028A14CA|nr:acyltransferase family protein [Kurthia massiliensis]
MPQPVKKNHRYISGLDGLRAISVLAVILYHLHFPWIYGGYLGVTVFFVLSGYLITDLLINEYQKTGTIDFKSFWIRRLRRLIPALFVMLILVTVWITLFQRDYLAGLRGEIGAAFVYISNWYYVWQDHSYFTKFAPPSPLQHMWSLAVEEQFYIVWPIIMLLALKFTKSSGKLALLVMLLSVVSAELMAFLYTPTEDPSRVYYGTDTRAFSLLIGAALAIVWPSRRLKPNVTEQMRRALNITGAVAFAGMLLFIIFLREDSQFLYYGGMYLASAIVAVLIAVIVHPASIVGDILSWRPLLWVGVRSYGIYIWHFPILVLLGLGVDTGEFHWWRVLIALVLTLVLSALSWKYLEDPIRKGEWRGWLKHAHPRNWSLNVRSWSGRTRVANIALGLILVVFTVGLILEPAPKASGNKALEEHLENEQQNLKKEMTPEEQKEAARQARIAEKKAAEQAAKEKSEKAKRELIKFNKDAKQARTVLANTSVTAIGDSVMLSAATDLRTNMPKLTVDASIGRQVDEAIDVLKAKQANGQIANTVLIGLGSNGTFTEEQFKEIYDILGPKRHIYLINVRVPRSWQGSVNKTLSNAAKAHQNVTLIDWYHKSTKRKNIFYDDKIHPNVEGSKYYADLIAIKISKTMQ